MVARPSGTLRGVRVELRRNGPRAEHKAGRYSDSPRPWKANEKCFAFTHWLFMGTAERSPPLLEFTPRG